jgi:extradiol dioxygenase family protein
MARQEYSDPVNDYDLPVLGDRSLIAFIPVSDLIEAQSFYVDVLGLRVTEESPYAVVLDAGGRMLRLTPVDGLQPQPFTVAGWDVPDIVESIDALVNRGVSFIRYEGMDQDVKGIWSTPTGDRVAWFKDPHGNTLSLTWFSEQQAQS